MSNYNLEPMFFPKTITIIGASGEESKLSARPLFNLKNNGYGGEVYPVNPKYEDIAGYKCFNDIESLPEGIDLAIISVGAKHVLPSLERLSKRQIKSAVVYSSGFAEAGTEGEELQEKLADFIKNTGIPVCGPNSLGFFNINQGVIGTFAALAFDKSDDVAFVTQSGAFGSFTYAMAKELGLGYNYFISTGNESGVDFFDYVDYFSNVNDVKVIGGYIEGARDFNKMNQAIDHANNNDKPIILMKVGSSKVGAEAAASHTSSMAGDQLIYESYFRQKNIVQVSDEEELVDTINIFSKAKRSEGYQGGVAIISISGGTGIVMADKCEEFGVELAELMPETTARLKELLPPFASVRNPIDITAQAIQSLHNLGECMKVLIDDKNVESVVFYMQLGDPVAPIITPVLSEVSNYTNKTFVVCWASPSEKTKKTLLDGGVCWLPTPTRTIKALGNLMAYNKRKKEVVAEIEHFDQQKVGEDVRKLLMDVKGSISEFTGKQILSEIGVSIPNGGIAKTAHEAFELSIQVGFPVVLKIVSKDIKHKSDIGGVVTDITSPNDVKEVYEKIMSDVKKNNPDAEVEGILVEKMAEKGIETMIGCYNDPLFGPCIMFGLGGIYVEVMSDVVVRKAPLSKQDAIEMVKEIKGYKLLTGVRGKPAGDINGLVDTLMSISHLFYSSNNIKELEINPLVVHSQGVEALDAVFAFEEHIIYTK